jgi:uncharacterized membrane protein YphA (DoxX/SURF4 family)
VPNPLTTKRYAISTATVIMLIVLRLNIGWHFFSEGSHHATDPHWSSEPVLRSATGPLAPLYKSYLPDFHGMDAWLHSHRAEKPADAVKGWLDEIQTDLDQRRQQFAIHYGLNEAQQKKATQVAASYQGKVRSWGGGLRDDLINHVHQWQRKETVKAAPDTADVPFRKQRVAESQATLTGETAGWKRELQDLEGEYENALGEILTAEQREEPPLPPVPTSIARVDRLMTYGILGIGVLLLLGLFTRTACLAGAAFLLSVVLTQPFWVSDAQPTFNQLVEMFALLALATTEVGRWAGLDFFVHQLILGRAGATKGSSDVSQS